MLLHWEIFYCVGEYKIYFKLFWLDFRKKIWTDFADIRGGLGCCKSGGFYQTAVSSPSWDEEELIRFWCQWVSVKVSEWAEWGLRRMLLLLCIYVVVF